MHSGSLITLALGVLFVIIVLAVVVFYLYFACRNQIQSPQPDSVSYKKKESVFIATGSDDFRPPV